MTAPSSLFVEALRDRYVLERELGRGGMATVYLAHDLKHDRDVALKVMRPELAATLGPERFLREIRTTARLQHPHILPVLDSGEAARELWYTMPYVRGESLRERLRREVQLPVGEALDLTRQVALALDCAHREGVVHRDLKPENILLSDGQALVADFGVAKALEAGGGGQLTATGMAVGTPQYMSPEQACGGRDLDTRSDIYSLGCVLYEALAGEPPFTGPTAQAVAAKRVFQPVLPLGRLRPGVPGWVDQAVAKALAPVPADRFPTAAEFARALVRPPPLDAGLSTRLIPASRAPLMRRRTIVLLSLLLCLALGGAWLARARLDGRDTPTGNPAMLAVLPLKNLGAPADQYFADGLTEEITSRLATVAGLGVISRTSADRYRDTRQPLKQVGRELGVDYVLEGSVRWERRPDGTSRIRVTPQLIRASDDRHLWAERYDADLADVFGVQASIAEQVTGALGVALAPRERVALAARPTADLSAYDAYLKGSAANPWDFTVGVERVVSGLRRAVEYYQEAVRLDSTFALAYAALGAAQTALASWRVEPERNARAARASITLALRLAPDLADAHASAGEYHFLISHDAEQGLRELERARALRPNDAGVLSAIAFFEWRLRGPQGRSLAFAERAVVLDPQSNKMALDLARFYVALGRYDEAERLYDRAIERDPHSNGPYVMKAFVRLLRDGDTLSARTIVRRAALVVDSTALVTAAAATAFGEIGPWATLGMLDEPYQRALLTLPPAAFGDDTAYYGVVKGYAFRARGQGAASRAYYDTAQRVAERRLRAFPADPSPLYWLLWTYAVQGRAREAYAALERLQKESGIAYFAEKHAWLARLAVLAGDTARALAELETRQWDSDITVPWLCADHFWDPLRAHPRFRRIVRGRC